MTKEDGLNPSTCRVNASKNSSKRPNFTLVSTSKKPKFMIDTSIKFGLLLEFLLAFARQVDGFRPSSLFIAESDFSSNLLLQFIIKTIMELNYSL